jgi:hypothetical protein
VRTIVELEQVSAEHKKRAEAFEAQVIEIERKIYEVDVKGNGKARAPMFNERMITECSKTSNPNSFAFLASSASYLSPLLFGRVLNFLRVDKSTKNAPFSVSTYCPNTLQQSTLVSSTISGPDSSATPYAFSSLAQLLHALVRWIGRGSGKFPKRLFWEAAYDVTEPIFSSSFSDLAIDFRARFIATVDNKETACLLYEASMAVALRSRFEALTSLVVVVGMGGGILLAL